MRLVLIVDDEPSIRRAMRRTLELEGYTVLESANGIDALVQVERSSPDIVITDLHMPGCSGFDLTHSVRQSDRRQPKVILLSDDDAETVAQRARALGATTLMKPFTREELIAAVAAVSEPPLHGKRILIVDDQPDVCLALKYLLETQGLVVADAGNGKEALDHLAAHPVDVVLTDLYMPGMDGIALLRALRAKPDGPSPAVIAYTGSALIDRQRLLAEARQLGARATLEKPLTSAALLRAIGEAVNRSAA